MLGELESLANLDLTSVSTDYPVLATGMYAFEIKSAKIEPTKKDQNAKMIVLDLELAQPAKDKNGADLQPGYKLTHRIGVTPTEKRTGEMIARDIATLLDAAYGESQRKQIKLAEFNIESLIGVTVSAKTSIDPEKDGYPEQARISRLVKRAE